MDVTRDMSSLSLSARIIERRSARRAIRSERDALESKDGRWEGNEEEVGENGGGWYGGKRRSPSSSRSSESPSVSGARSLDARTSKIGDGDGTRDVSFDSIAVAVPAVSFGGIDDTGPRVASRWNAFGDDDDDSAVTCARPKCGIGSVVTRKWTGGVGGVGVGDDVSFGMFAWMRA